MPPDFTPFTDKPDFSFFHSRQWIDALLTTFPRWQDVSEVIHLPDGRDVLLPLLQTDRVGFWRWLEAMPFGFYGGPIVSEGTLNHENFAFILQHFNQRAGWLALNLDPCDALAKADMIPFGATTLTTHLLSLEGGVEKVEAGFSKMVHRHLRSASRDGVVIRRGNSLRDFSIYAHLMQAATRRWKIEKPPFPSALYEALAMLPAEKVKLWLAEYEGKTVGGLVSIHYTPERVMYWSGALDEDYARLNASKLLQHEAIRDACTHSAKVYNMGPSIGFDGKQLDGVRQAKEALGAATHDYSIAILMNPWAMRLRALRTRLFHR